MSERETLLPNTSNNATPTQGGLSASSSTTVRAAFSAEDLTSFPCLSTSTTTTLYDGFVWVWTWAQRLLPCAQGFFIYCEDEQLAGATVIGVLVAIFVLLGFGVVFPAMIYTPYLRLFLQCLFGLQTIVGYSCLFLFRNIDPGYLPVNEGPLGQSEHGGNPSSAIDQH